MGKCEYHMKVRGINDFCTAFVYPDLFFHCLTVRAVAITAGIVMDLCMTAFRTLSDVHPHCRCFAVQDSLGNFLVFQQMIRKDVLIGLMGIQPDLLDGRILHDSPPIMASKGLFTLLVVFTARWT